MYLRKKIFSKKLSHPATLVMDLHQGDCVQLLSCEDLFQVIGVDSDHNKCWIRRWPLMRKGSPVFEIPIKQIAIQNKDF